MSFWALLVLIGLAWLTYPLAGAADVSADASEGISPNHAGFSFLPELFLLPAVEWAVALIAERRDGLWRRLRSAPVSRRTLVPAKGIGSTAVSLLITAVVFAFGAAAFGIRVKGDPRAFALIAVAWSATAAAFALLVASLGRSPSSARSVPILAVLAMVMLGGGWIPSFLFPAWLLRLTPAIPTRWAIDGFDGVLSRGDTLAGTLPTVWALVGFASGFGLLAMVGSRWGEG